METKKLTIPIDKKLHKDTTMWCKRNDVTMAQMVRIILRSLVNGELSLTVTSKIVKNNVDS